MAASVSVGAETTYTGNMIAVRELEDAITLISRDDYPLLRTIGFNSYGSVSNKKVEWQEDQLMPLSVYLDDSGGAVGTATTSITVQANTSGGDATGYVKPGDLLFAKIADGSEEVLWVTAVDGEDLTVVRGWGGTSGIDLADNDELFIIGNAHLEGSSPGRARSIAVSTANNYTQIWSEDVEITGSETQFDLYGPDGGELLQYRLDKRLRELYQKMERWLLYSQVYAPSDNTEARTADGIAAFLEDGGYSTEKDDAALTEADFVDEMETIFINSGQQYVPDLVVGNSWPKRKWTAWYRGLIMTERAERVGGSRIDMIETDFGPLGYMIDHLVLPNDVYMLNTEFIMTAALGNRTLKEFDATIPGKDHMARRLLGEYTIIVKNPQTMRRIHEFSTSS